ncbi:beta-N-acetylhexosaminidase [Thermocrispum municipale]|uniref:beta-N-acetylhexosaminidase n=1 Tax=Thermocrispum municipale TaxID=37926 RepID=UPI00048B8436|nr:beta-N-acetylhexosaminidase [Thermocrispum municipale]
MTPMDGLVPRPVRVDPAPGVCELDDLVVPVVVDPAAGLPAEGYRIRIAPSGVHAVAADEAGKQHAEQTLRQLAGPETFRAANIHSGRWVLPCGEIVDHPRFAWRGCLLDVARHFQPKAAVLRFIDLLAAHKLNVLHLHLTDDQGWRIEVPEYPRLTEVGGWREGSWVGRPPDGTEEHDGRPHGGYYTTGDLREIVAYARERAVTVVPEVDIPGHSQAAIAAYPELGNTGAALPVRTAWGISEHVLNAEESTVAFYRRVFEHLVDIFDGPVIAVGGDEVPTVEWREHAAARAAELGLSSPDDLHGWWIAQIAGHVAGLGRRPLAWDEAVDAGPLPPDTIVASWRGEHGGIAAAQAGHDVVMCPEQHVYLDHRQSDRPDEPIPVGYLVPLRKVYQYEPIPDGMPETVRERVLGAQAQVWTEHLDNPRRVDYAAFPRLAAFAEVVWSPPEREYDEFERRLVRHHLPRLDALGVEYRPLEGPRPWQTRPGVPGRPR